MASKLAIHDLVDVPTVAEYKRAFLKCRPLLPGKRYLEMLKAHYRAPDHTVTAGELAEAVGFPSYSAANLQYGTFACDLCEALGRPREHGVAILVTFSGRELGDELIRWTMIPQVVAALEEMRWVQRQAPT